jgi:hypothetical protein
LYYKHITIIIIIITTKHNNSFYWHTRFFFFIFFFFSHNFFFFHFFLVYTNCWHEDSWRSNNMLENARHLFYYISRWLTQHDTKTWGRTYIVHVFTRGTNLKPLVDFYIMILCSLHLLSLKYRYFEIPIECYFKKIITTTAAFLF